MHKSLGGWPGQNRQPGAGRLVTTWLLFILDTLPQNLLVQESAFVFIEYKSLSQFLTFSELSALQFQNLRFRCI